jgi:hypothetical protein
MDEKEKLAFLKRMGLSAGRMGKTDEEIRRRTRTDTRVEKSDLLALANCRSFVTSKTAFASFATAKRQSRPAT